MRIFVPDPCPGELLSAIHPISRRAKSWYARVWERMAEDQCMNCVAAVGVVAGLDYHQSRFMQLAELLQPYFYRASKPLRIHDGSSVQEHLVLSSPTPEEMAASEALDCEAVAYFNRLGQFYYFARSRELLSAMPRTQELIVFRNKHTAHLSADVPRRESPAEIATHSAAFGFSRILKDGSPTYQIRDGDLWRTFTMSLDHPLVMNEAMNALLALHRCDDA